MFEREKTTTAPSERCSCFTSSVGERSDWWLLFPVMMLKRLNCPYNLFENLRPVQSLVTKCEQVEVASLAQVLALKAQQV